jgi:pyruvate carboxylase
VRIHEVIIAVGDVDERGYRTAHISLNGQVRPVEVRDRTVEAPEDKVEKADPDEPGHVAAPLTGVVTVAVAAGAQVEAGQAGASIEGMKMESAVSSPVGGLVERVATSSGKNVEPGDLLLVIAPAEAGEQ